MAITLLPTWAEVFKSINFTGGSTVAPTLNTTDDWLAWGFEWPGGDLTRSVEVATTVSGSPIGTVQLFAADGSTPALVDTASAIGAAVDTATLVAGVPQIVSGVGQTALAAGFYFKRIIFKSGTSFTPLQNYNGLNDGGTTATQTPYPIQVANGGVQAVQANQGCQFAVGSATEWAKFPGVFPPFTFGSAFLFSSSSNPDEYGIWFTNPFPYAIRISGVRFWNQSSTRPDIAVTYYTSGPTSPTQAFSQTFSRTKVRSTAVSGFNFLPLSDSNKQWLDVGESVGMGLRAETAHNIGLNYWDVGSGNAAVLDAGWGQSVHLFTREAASGDLTFTLYRQPHIFPTYDAVDVPTGETIRRHFGGNFARAA